MKKVIILSVLALIAIAAIAGSLYINISRANKAPELASLTIPEPKDDKSVLSEESQVPDSNIAADASSVPLVSPTPIAPKTEQKKDTTSPQAPPSNNQKVVQPIDRFNERITLNAFGNQPSKMELDESQYTDLVCKEGKYYPGYHTAVDLETFPEERNTPVAVVSIADGIVRQVSFINGYGGLIVAEYNIGGNTYTAYYGHVDLNTAKVKSGSKLTAGQKIAELGPHCSGSNGNTRKHLHFGMHKGKAIVVSGYVDARGDLANWTDPRTIIK